MPLKNIVNFIDEMKYYNFGTTFVNKKLNKNIL